MLDSTAGGRAVILALCLFSGCAPERLGGEAPCEGEDCASRWGHCEQLPWEGAGVTAVYLYQGTQTVISRSHYWTLDVESGTWGAHGHLSVPWAGAPDIDGQLPWEGPGVTASVVHQDTQTVISVDRYWTIDLATATWGERGYLSDTSWADAPEVHGRPPWDDGGITASYLYEGVVAGEVVPLTQTVISRDRFWTFDTTTGTWDASGHLSVPWAEAPEVDGVLPWEGRGVTASEVREEPERTTQTAISVDRYWTIDTPTGTWGARGHLEDLWADAPSVRIPCPW